MPTATGTGAVIEGRVVVDKERDDVGVVITDSRGVVSVELSWAGGQQVLAGDGWVSDRPVERELMQHQHTQRYRNDTQQQQQLFRS
jgi:hypothetical protein